MKLEQIANLYREYKIFACDEDSEIHIFDNSDICIASFSYYGYEEDDGEYKPSTVGLGEDSKAVFYPYADNHCTIRRIRCAEYEQSKKLFMKACKVAFDIYFQWRNHFNISDDADFKKCTDVVFAIDELLNEEEV